MEIAMIGLGKMGAGMVSRLLKGGHRVVVHDKNPAAVRAAEAEGAKGAHTLEEIAKKLSPPRAAWVMVPAGEPTGRILNDLSGLLSPGDVIVDGGNSWYRDTVRRAEVLAEKGILLIDAGTSGGIGGRTAGYCLMIGGDGEAAERLRPVFRTLAPAPDTGWGMVGPSGAGHFVKMIHNGIEYGLMEAYAEGFELMRRKTDFNLDLARVAEIWRTGSVVRSWLLDLIAGGLAENPDLEGIAAQVPDSGEGRWTVSEAVDLGCAIPCITLALQRRFRSRDAAPFAEKLLAALRGQFGGHEVKAEES
ncbi:MAG: decarboxylating 6-phosphogluconate dehydrogenase [PVC group bacterium]